VTAVSPGIFKAYDVRGTYPDQIDEDVAYRVGRGFARVLRDLREAGDRTLHVAVGHDMRLHSPALAGAFSRGLTDEGCDVLDIGEAGTEMVYYAVGSRELDGGVSVTASHNPKQWAGFKLLREGALPLSGDRGIPDVQRVVAEEDFSTPNGTGTIERADLYEDFQRYVVGFIDTGAIRPMKVVLDGGNGMAGPMIGPIIDSFPIEGERLYF
jgi:phosphomannomutase